MVEQHVIQFVYTHDFIHVAFSEIRARQVCRSLSSDIPFDERFNMGDSESRFPAQ